MIAVTQEERNWFLNNIAQGLIEYMGAVGPPVQVEQMLNHPPPVYNYDFGVVDMYSNLWDATFARPPSRRGSIFVRINLSPEQRRYALARESLSAIITSRHGRALGLADLFMDSLHESAEHFAWCLLAPKPMVEAYWQNGGSKVGFAGVFGIPQELAERYYGDGASVFQ
jgi:hypothetical protein